MRGVEVSRRFYDAKVAPCLDGVPHAAGRIGRGSDVLGFDDDVSQDHDWGDRVTVITDRPTPPLPEGVELFTFASFVDAHLGRVPRDDIDWLLLTGRSVLEVIAGPVFHDDVGDLRALRRSLAWYPPSVEQYVVASSWRRIDQELPFIGRTRDRGDDIGHRVITARVARAVMHLGFLRERRWPPYAKWYGSAYGPRSNGLDGEGSICAALDELAGGPGTVPAHDRPYRAIDPGFLASLHPAWPFRSASGRWRCGATTSTCSRTRSDGSPFGPGTRRASSRDRAIGLTRMVLRRAASWSSWWRGPSVTPSDRRALA